MKDQQSAAGPRKGKTWRHKGASSRKGNDLRDPCTDLLLNSLPKDARQHTLVLVDENARCEDYASLAERPNTHFISNRFNLAENLGRFARSADFSDFVFADIESHSLDCLVFRVAKEKAVVHHVINQAVRLLKAGGTLHLAGMRRDGTKTYLAKAASLLGECISVKTTRIGARCGVLRLQKTDVPPANFLPDNGYSLLRLIETDNGCQVYSKPGCFGWNKVDQGSRMLISCVPGLAGQHVLDLGCGYGYLSIHAQRLGAASVLATDNNAAALEACRRNFQNLQIPGEVIASDCGDGLKRQFDCVLSNPPFHRGFRRDHETATRFLQNMARFLAPAGNAFIVVNAKMPYEKLGADYFANVEVLAQQDAFKVLHLAQPTVRRRN